MSNRSNYSSADIGEKLWDKAKKIPGKNPDLYRQDPYRNIMYKSSYGKDTEMGWEIDHINPKANGGSDDIRNLQPLNTAKNREKGASKQKKSRHSKCNK